MVRDPNRATLAAYDAHVSEYVTNSPAVIDPVFDPWIDAALALTPRGSTILELGSGTGRDALSIEARGFRVIRSDASRGFVARLQAEGHEARLLDVLTDDLGGPHPLIFANAVLLHLTDDQMAIALTRIRKALRPGGVLACSLKQGDGTSVSDEKLGAPRFFRFWQRDELFDALRTAGFETIGIEVIDIPGERSWLTVIAR